MYSSYEVGIACLAVDFDFPVWYHRDRDVAGWSDWHASPPMSGQGYVEMAYTIHPVPTFTLDGRKHLSSPLLFHIDK